MEWIANPQQIADGYGIDVEEWIDSVSGSTTSFLTEAKVAKLLGGERVKGSQLPYDVVVEGRDNKQKLETFVRQVMLTSLHQLQLVRVDSFVRRS